MIAIFKILSSGLSIINKLLPSWEWKGGQAAAQRDAAKGSADAGRRARTIEDEVRNLDGTALDDELRRDGDND